MIRGEQITGAIFDVDDTLLDNKSGIPGEGLHEKSRLTAIHFVGKKYEIPELQSVTAIENFEAFGTSRTHSVEGAVWNLMHIKGLVDTSLIDRDNPLLQEITNLKDSLHVKVLLSEGNLVPGADRFILGLASIGLGHMAIGSSAPRRDIDLFLDEVSDLRQYFPDQRIMSRESVTHFKPHPEVFDKAFASLDLPKTSRRTTIVVEDDPRGIEAGHKAGLFTVGITTRFSKSDLKNVPTPPDLVVDSYKELSKLLEVPFTTRQN